MATKTAAKKKKELSFEEGMQQLESLVQRMSDGDLPLEESIQMYEQGSALVKELKQKLEQHRRRIEMIDPDTAEIEAFEDGENDVQ